MRVPNRVWIGVLWEICRQLNYRRAKKKIMLSKNWGQKKWHREKNRKKILKKWINHTRLPHIAEWRMNAILNCSLQFSIKAANVESRRWSSHFERSPLLFPSVFNAHIRCNTCRMVDFFFSAARAVLFAQFIYSMAFFTLQLFRSRASEMCAIRECRLVIYALLCCLLYGDWRKSEIVAAIVIVSFFIWFICLLRIDVFGEKKMFSVQFGNLT